MRGSGGWGRKPGLGAGGILHFVQNDRIYAGYDSALVRGYPPTFADVPLTHPFTLYIERAFGHGALHGYPCGGRGEPCDAARRPYFRPAGLVTRGEAAQALANAAGYTVPPPPGRQTLRDVPPGSGWWRAVEQGAAARVVHGYADGTYRPAGLVTRGQAAQVYSRAFFPGCGLPRP